MLFYNVLRRFCSFFPSLIYSFYVIACVISADHKCPGHRFYFQLSCLLISPSKLFFNMQSFFLALPFHALSIFPCLKFFYLFIHVTQTFNLATISILNSNSELILLITSDLNNDFCSS
jgi:hypothetical protein